MNLQAVDKWHHTRSGHLIFGLAELGLAYLFISLAINSGSLWQYALAIIFFAGSIQNLVRIFKTAKNERAQR
jgi:hypothetical protein